MYSLSLYKWKHFQSNEVYTGRVRLGCLECLHPGFVVAVVVVIEFGLIDSRLGFVQIWTEPLWRVVAIAGAPPNTATLSNASSLLHLNIECSEGGAVAIHPWQRIELVSQSDPSRVAHHWIKLSRWAHPVTRCRIRVWIVNLKWFRARVIESK